MTFYWDTSALVSIYLPDIHSAAAARFWVLHAGSILLTPLQQLELANAIELRVFRREIGPALASRAHQAFADDVDGNILRLQPLDPEAFRIASHLSRSRTAQLGVRSLDALHVASALALRAGSFLTFDQRQRRLAEAEGLRVG